jgi:hypothetical protein
MIKDRLWNYQRYQFKLIQAEKTKKIIKFKRLKSTLLIWAIQKIILHPHKEVSPKCKILALKKTKVVCN